MSYFSQRYAIIGICLLFSYAQHLAASSAANIHSPLEKYHLDTHFRQSTSLTDQPNRPVIERVTSHSICFNNSIVREAANLVRINGISKANAVAFLTSHPNASFFCNLPAPNGCAPPLLEFSLHCDPNYPYRSANGSCNNLQHTLWGAAEQPFQRFLPPDYEDGVTLPRGFNRAVNPLPAPRAVSNALEAHPVNGTIITTLLTMQWGQFMDHDLTLTPEVSELTQGIVGHLINIPCCEFNDNSAGEDNEDCFPIVVAGDPFYSQFGRTCLRLSRSLPTTRSCRLGQREQSNVLTNFADGSNVYGSSVEEEHSLRSFVSGRLLENTKTESVSCPNRVPFPYLPEYTGENGEKSFFAGDDRVIEQPGLTSMHSLFFRAHNGLASQFQAKYPDMSDEEIYQETRRIVSALIQRITYGEFLPIIIGAQRMQELGLSLLTSGHTNNYDSSINPTTPNVFAIAYRFGHTLIPDFYHLSRRTVALAESFFNNDVTQIAGSEPSDFLEGLSHLPSEFFDHVLVRTLTNKVLATFPYTNGSDLYALNIQRGRDHGIPGYNDWRRFCNLSVVPDFHALTENHIMRPEAVEALKSTYASVDDIDIFPGGVSELSVGDGIVGPLLNCVVGQHFRNIKLGDRFWFESETQPKPFTNEQLDAIRRTSLSSLICHYSTVNSIQPRAMLLSTIPGNNFMPCSDFPQDTVTDLLEELW